MFENEPSFILLHFLKFRIPLQRSNISWKQWRNCGQRELPLGGLRVSERWFVKHFGKFRIAGSARSA